MALKYQQTLVIDSATNTSDSEKDKAITIERQRDILGSKSSDTYTNFKKELQKELTKFLAKDKDISYLD